jgi:hypothetical protein
LGSSSSVFVASRTAERFLKPERLEAHPLLWATFATERVFAYAGPVADLPIPELVENRRRSIAMLQPGAPALNRDEALEVLGQLVEALQELRNLRRQRG